MSTDSKKAEEKLKEEEEKKKKEENRLKKFKVTNKYDPYLLKNSLDECIKEVIKEKYKFPENHHYENVKILLGIVICSVVALSHYYPLPFPLNYNLIIACIVIYAILTAIYTYFEAKVENDCFILFKPDFAGILRFSSKIKLCSEFYDINLVDYENKQIAVRKSLSVGDFFDIKGNIGYDRVQKLVEDMFKEMKDVIKKNEKKSE